MVIEKVLLLEVSVPVRPSRCQRSYKCKGERLRAVRDVIAVARDEISITDQKRNRTVALTAWLQLAHQAAGLRVHLEHTFGARHGRVDGEGARCRYCEARRLGRHHGGGGCGGAAAFLAGWLA